MDQNKTTKPCYVTIFQNDKSASLSNYTIDHLTITFTAENELAQDLDKSVYHRTMNKSNSNYELDSKEAEVLSSGDDFITYKISQSFIQSVENPSGRVNMKVKINETMKDGETFIFDVIVESERRHVIPQNGEYTLIEDSKDRGDENQLGDHNVEIFIDNDGYLMIDPLDCYGSVFIDLFANDPKHSYSYVPMYDLIQ